LSIDGWGVSCMVGVLMQARYIVHQCFPLGLYHSDREKHPRWVRHPFHPLHYSMKGSPDPFINHASRSQRMLRSVHPLQRSWLRLGRLLQTLPFLHAGAVPRIRGLSRRSIARQLSRNAKNGKGSGTAQLFQVTGFT